MKLADPYMKKELENHILEEIPAGERIKAFYLKKPGAGRMPLGSDYLCSKFLDKEWVREYAVEYCRDYAKEIRRGDWDDYSHPKELKSAYDRRAGIIEDLERARQNLKEEREVDDPEKEKWIAQYRAEIREWLDELPGARADLIRQRDEYAKQYEALANDTEQWWYGPEKFGEELQKLDVHSCDDGVPGYGYPPISAAWLCAIQGRFAELYHETVGVKS